MTTLGRARFLWQAGYSVLLFDFQAHGESPGEHITFGHLESRDVRAVVKYARRRDPDHPLGLIGVSLGGAAALLCDGTLGLSAAILEAVYPTIDEAVANRVRMRLGPLATVLAPLLLAQVEPRLGFSPNELRPIDGIPTIGCPVLVVAGSDDRHTRLEESRRLFDRAIPPKELWVIPEAAHVDFHRHAGAEYELRFRAFFEKHLSR